MFDIPVDPKEIYLALFPRAYQPLAVPWEDPTSQSWGRHLARKAVRPQDVLNGGALSRLEQLLLRDYAAGIGFAASDWRGDEYGSVVFGLPEADEGTP